MKARRTASLAVVAIAGALVMGAAGRAPGAGSQLDFGVDMARRGLWREALFRFQQARLTEGGSARVLNNLAVAYEALGQFDQALETYREALAAAPGDSDLKRNYSQFLEFYQGYQDAPAAEPPAAEPAPPGEEGG